MKSAYELALERSGGKLNAVSSEDKEKLAEIDRCLKAKLAGIDISYAQKLATADPQQRLQLEEDKAVEIASARSKAERDKKAIRSE